MYLLRNHWQMLRRCSSSLRTFSIKFYNSKSSNKTCLNMSFVFLSTYDVLSIKWKRQKEDQVETMPCEDNTRPFFGDHKKSHSRKYKGTKIYIIVKKLKASQKQSLERILPSKCLRCPSIRWNFGSKISNAQQKFNKSVVLWY